MRSDRVPPDFPLESDPIAGEVDFRARDLPADKNGSLACKALLGFRRCRDYDEDNGEGQDYAWLNAGQNIVIAVLADGVSQSFYGQIAAQQIVRGLSEYMVKGHSLADRHGLMTTLRRLAKDAGRDVRTRQLRPGLSTTMVELLEADRLMGSQAVFGAFIYDRASRRLAACQLGDVRLRIFRQDAKGAIVQDLVPANKRGRFSTVATADPDDPKLDADLVTQSFENVVGVLLHSDGVDDRWAEKPSMLEEDQRGSLNEALHIWAKADDVSIVGVLSEPVLRWTRQNAPLAPEVPPLANAFSAGRAAQVDGGTTSTDLVKGNERAAIAGTDQAFDPDTGRGNGRKARAPKPSKTGQPALKSRPIRLAGIVAALMLVSFVVGRNIGAASVPRQRQAPAVQARSQGVAVSEEKLNEWQTNKERIVDEFFRDGYLAWDGNGSLIDRSPNRSHLAALQIIDDMLDTVKPKAPPVETPGQ